MTVHIISEQDALSKLSSGFNQLADVLAMTLGPQRGTILSSTGSGAPEILTESGVIARRVTDLPSGAENVGAMLLRAMAWELHERYGDGAATAAVLARGLVNEAARRIAAGANPMILRRGIECGAAAAIESLEMQAVPAIGQNTLQRLAENVTGDAPLSRILGEMFNLLGADGALEIEEFVAPYLDYEYLDGGYWRAHPAARAFIPNGRPEAVLENPVVLATDQELERVDQVRPILEWITTLTNRPPLVLIAPAIRGDALTALTMNHARGVLNIGAVVINSTSTDLQVDLEDISMLTGGKAFISPGGRALEPLQPTHFGQARRVLLSRERLTIIGGTGDLRARKACVQQLRVQLANDSFDLAERERLQKRVGRLSGGIGILKVGAYSERERERQKMLAHKLQRVLFGALNEGLVSGGGVAYLNSIPAVMTACENCAEPDQAMGIQVVAAALESPFRQMVHNHGHESPSVALETVRRMGSGYGFDARNGNYGCFSDIGLMDSLAVTRGALAAAASTAATAITIGRIVTVC